MVHSLGVIYKIQNADDKLASSLIEAFMT